MVADNLILEPDVVKVDYILNRPFLGDGYSGHVMWSMHMLGRH